MKFNLQDKVAAFFIKHPDEKCAARDIARWIFDTYPEECLEKQNRSTAINSQTELIQQLVSEIGARRPQLEKTGINTTEEHPRKYYYSSGGAETVPVADSTPEPARISEHSLYPLLRDFLLSELDVRSMRIDEKRSRNSRGAGGNEWLYPDLVGMEDLSREWHREVSACVKQYSDKKTRLWSFEVKKLISRSNIRKVFFQAVSNSSWANFGYLVASEIEGSDTLKEMRILAGLHGIGFIRLDIKNPSESQIMVPARERQEIDWNIANRLAEENRDFLDYIKLVRQFYQTGEVYSAAWKV